MKELFEKYKIEKNMQDIDFYNSITNLKGDPKPYSLKDIEELLQEIDDIKKE